MFCVGICQGINEKGEGVGKLNVRLFLIFHRFRNLLC